uniref:Leucine-rich repeat-containing N-terminal plant-type domain-containing protein n=1 Tax=Setaria viridis TaxID=4556 RepID=A0A4U6TME6_SETVI|nr:hypothetical protein SEVIR_8G197400v2 [Setaria viridis]
MTLQIVFRLDPVCPNRAPPESSSSWLVARRCRSWRYPDSGGADHCTWPEVTCDARSRVVALEVPSPSRRSVPGRELAGELPATVGLLTELKEISFPFHGLRGEIPCEIWGLEKLEVVNLAGNSLQGALPAVFPPRLRVLTLASNLLHAEGSGTL